MSETPKTITLYGRGKRRYPVVPGVWADCLKEARRLKAWAAQVKDDRKWKAGACQMSLEHLAHVLATGLTDLAKEGYRYLEMRAHLGNPQCWDRPARVRWLELGGRIRRPRKPTQATPEQATCY
jgi:hypothetical protein